MTVDEPERLVYTDAWAGRFASEQRRLAVGLAVPKGRLQHIGSTAVPGLLSKDIVDMMLGLDAYPPPTALVERLTSLGYEDCGEVGVVGRRYFRRRGAVSFNLHAVHMDGEHWRNNLALRDYLRRDIEAAIRYGTAKWQALQKDAHSLLGYSDVKARMVATLLKEAWRARP